MSIKRAEDELKKSEVNIDICWWVLFFVLSLAGGFLSYSSFGIEAKGIIFLLGIVFPLYLAIRALPILRPSGESFSPREEGSLFSGMVFVLLSLAAIFLRFYRLQTFHAWPSGDESLQGFFAIDLIQNWNWRFFYTTGQHPPLLIWLLKWFFQNIRAPFFDLWFLPALTSVLFVFLSYWTARVFFKKSFSLIYFCLLTTAFWPVYFGRFCVQGVLIPLFETVGFLLLGYFLKVERPTSKKYFAMGLGFWIGLGTWAYTSWFS